MLYDFTGTQKFSPITRHTPDTLSEKYDEIYSKAEIIIKSINPCEINYEDGSCRRGKSRFCCDGCSHLSDTGCTTKPLFCKLWFCSPASDYIATKHPYEAEELNKLIKEAESYRLLHYRASKEESMKIRAEILK